MGQQKVLYTTNSHDFILSHANQNNFFLIEQKRFYKLIKCNNPENYL